MDELFKSLGDNVSEACFDDILDIVEELVTEADGIMQLVKKYDGDKEKAKKEWVKQQNNELVKLAQDYINKRRRWKGDTKRKYENRDRSGH